METEKNMKQIKYLLTIAAFSLLLFSCDVDDIYNDSNISIYNKESEQSTELDSENETSMNTQNNSGSEIDVDEITTKLDEQVEDNEDNDVALSNIVGESTSLIVDESVKELDAEAIEAMFLGHSYLYVAPGDIHQERIPNVVVDIGYGQRYYWSLTNEFSQVYRVVAEEIILQDESTETVNSDGRYYSQIADVTGTESSALDRGHIIADSLGGENSKFNITPQNSTLNRYGDQAYMEDTIRKAIRAGSKVSDFEAIITYPNTETQIPSQYKYIYYIDGEKVVDEFDNVNPDEVNAALDESNSEEDYSSLETDNPSMTIIKLDKKAEYIILKNNGDGPINLQGWTIISVRGNQTFTFPSYIIEASSTVTVGDETNNDDIDFHWLDRNRGTWNNSQSDPAELLDPNGVLINRWDD